MTFHNTSIKTIASAVVVASALALGSGAAVAQPTLRAGETSIDSGVVGGSSNLGMHPSAQPTNATEGRFDHFHTVADNQSTAGEVSIDSAGSGDSVSNHGMTPDAVSANRYQQRTEAWNGQPADDANTSIDSAAGGDQLSNHGLTPNNVDANANQPGSQTRHKVTVNHTPATSGNGQRYED